MLRSHPPDFRLKTQDSEYRLVNQAAMLLGFSQLHKVWNTDNAELIPSLEWLIAAIWKTIDERFDEKNSIWFSRIPDEEASQTSEDNQVAVYDLLLTVLATDAAKEVNNSWLGSFAYEKRIEQTVQFLRARTNEDGGLSEAVSLERDQKSTQNSSFFSSMALVRMEILAGEEEQALKRFGDLENLFWDGKFQLYQPTTAFFDTTEYDPILVAGYAGLLTRMDKNDLDPGQSVYDRGIGFIERILFQSGLQISAAETKVHEKTNIISQDSRKILPLVQVEEEKNSGENFSGSLAPVAVRGVSLQLRQNFLDKSDDESASDAYRNLQGAGSPYPGKLLSQYKSREINTERAALGMLYLEATSNSLSQYSEQGGSPYLGTISGLDELAAEGERIWQANLYSLLYHYERGIPLAYSTDMLKQARASEDEPRQIYVRAFKELKEEYLDGDEIEELLPIYLEYTQGEPFDPSVLTGWSAQQLKTSVSLTAMVQLGRAQLHFLKKNGERCTIFPTPCGDAA